MGLTCVGAKLDRAVFGSVALLAGNHVYASLPLQAAFAPSAVDAPPPGADVLQIHFASGDSRWVRFSQRQPIAQADADCPARAAGTEVARIIMRLSHRERLRDPMRRVDMSALLGGTIGPRSFAGKHVLVGAEHPLDTLQTRMDINGFRYGFEFHADVVNALLNDQPIHPMPFSAQWLMALLMILIAAGYRLWRLSKPHRLDWLALTGGCIAYFAAAVVLYTRFGLLADGLYHVAAFCATWWILALLERRWSRAPSHITA